VCFAFDPPLRRKKIFCSPQPSSKEAVLSVNVSVPADRFKGSKATSRLEMKSSTAKVSRDYF
jgi:hypothetical protein